VYLKIISVTSSITGWGKEQIRPTSKESSIPNKDPCGTPGMTQRQRKKSNNFDINICQLDKEPTNVGTRKTKIISLGISRVRYKKSKGITILKYMA
jgi:hypothetical protein